MKCKIKLTSDPPDVSILHKHAEFVLVHLPEDPVLKKYRLEVKNLEEKVIVHQPQTFLLRNSTALNNKIIFKYLI